MRAELRLVWLALFSVLVMAASVPYHYLALALLLTFTLVLLRARPSRTVKVLAPAMPFMLMIAVMQALFTGMEDGCAALVRMLLLFICGAGVTQATPADELAAAIENFFLGSSTGRDIATMFMLAMAFLPMVGEEYGAIRLAMEARGVSFDGPLRSIKGATVIIVPMLKSLAHKADNVALAMQARCYGLD